MQDQLNNIHAVPSSSNESVKSFRCIQNTVNDCLAILKSYKIYPFLIHVVVSKLSNETVKECEMPLKNHCKQPTLPQFHNFLSERIEILETISDRKKVPPKDSSSSRA